jgi:hypothetical protein
MKKIVSLLVLSLLLFCSCDTLLEASPIGNSNYEPGENEVLLDSSKTFASQVGDSEKIYVIRDTFDLGKAEVSIGKNSILKFAGGSVKNGTVVFNNTKITGYPNFTACNYKGNLTNDEVDLDWFNFDTDKTHKYSSIEVPTQDPAVFQQILDCLKSGTQLNINKIYAINKPVKIRKKISLKGADRSEGIYADRIVQNMEYGFFNCNTFNSLFEVENGGEISVHGLSLVGYPSLYMGGSLWEKCYPNGNLLSSPISCSGIDVKKGGKIGEIHDSSFVAFTYGIRSNGGTIGYIRNSYFSICRFGFWAKDTDNFELRGCRLNSNELNFHFYEKNLNYIGNSSNNVPLKETDADQIVKMGGGLYLNNCKNVQVTNCRFEFNYIQVLIDDSAENVTIHNCIMDCATLCHIAINNQGASTSSTTRAINNLTFSACTLARGARCDIANATSVPGFGIFYFCDIGNRGALINFKNIIVSDDMEVDKTIDVRYEAVVFDIYNKSNTNGTVLNLEGNSFYSSEATKIFNVVSGSSGSFKINASGNDYGDKTLKSGVTSVLNITEN